MSKHLLAWSRRMSHSSWLAGVALVPGVLQDAPPAANSGALIILGLDVRVREELAGITRAQHVRDVEERRALDLRAEIDKRCLHPGEYRVTLPR